MIGTSGQSPASPHRYQQFIAGEWATRAAVLLAGAIEAGVVNINGPTMYAEPILPIGGVKESGWGRFGRLSVENFTDRNLITVHHGKPPRTL